MSDTPRYAPGGYSSPMAAAQHDWLARKQDPAYSQTAKIAKHYLVDLPMAGPNAMGQVAHGELDPLSREGIARGMASAWSLPMQSPFVPRGAVGAGGGRMNQPPPVNSYGKSKYTYTPGANENVPGGGPGISQAEVDASLERLNQALAPYNARDKFQVIEGGGTGVARYVPGPDKV